MEKIMTLVVRPQNEIANHHAILDVKYACPQLFCFEEWCKHNKLKSMPSDVPTVVRYLTDRAWLSWTRFVRKRKGRGKNMRIENVLVTFQPLKPSSLERKLSAISKAHQYAGYSFDRKNVILAEILKGIKRAKGTAQEQKTPILTDDVKAMTQNLNGIQGIRDKAIILLGFSGAMRRSEIVNLQIKDLNEVEKGYEVIVRFSKTDQEGKGKTKAIPYVPNSQTCPVMAIKAWLNELRKCGIVDGVLFRAIDRYGNIRNKGMCSASIALIIKRNEHLKERSDKFGGHSLRAGFCTQSALNDVPDSMAMVQSGHKDANTYKKYVRIADLWKNSAVKKLGL